MRFLFVLFFASVALAKSPEAALGKKSVVQFLNAKESRAVITRRDDFVSRLSPFDRAARLKVDKPVSEEQYLAFVGENVRDWTDDEIRKLRAIIEAFPPLLTEQPFPATIQLIKTTGAEEGNAAYTRGTAVMIPIAELGNAHLEKLICHELFHILSRGNPELREKLYNLIGFTGCDEIDFPRELAARKITNPDAPRNDHFIRLQIGGKTCPAIPVLLSTVPVYDVKKGGEFFAYLTFQFLVMEETGNSRRLKVVYENGAPKLAAFNSVTGFFERVGRNTDYIIHPEEILADNFALVVLGGEKIASPEIVEKMKTILSPKVK